MKKILLLKLVFLLSFCFIGSNIVKGEEVHLNQSGWTEPQGTRSGDLIPISAWTENGYLIVEYPNPMYDITLSISKVDNDYELIHKQYDKSSCCIVSIPLTGLEDGYYRLTILNNAGGSIIGTFAVKSIS